jgi:DNA invertase Pin-like site-specific DNA recombinase
MPGRDSSTMPNGGGAEDKTTLHRALDDAHAGTFPVPVVWALDRIVREGAEDALRIFWQFRQRGCVVVPVREAWLNRGPQVQDVLIAFAGWMAAREPARKSERIKAELGKPDAGKPAGSPAARPPRRASAAAAWQPGSRAAPGARRRTGGEGRHDDQERPDCRGAAGAGLRRRARHAL